MVWFIWLMGSIFVATSRTLVELFTDKTGTRRTSTLVTPTYISDADTIPRRDKITSRVLTIANNRGGIGKTTAALNLGFALAQQGNRVLMVDMDGQASLTLALPPPAIGREPKARYAA